MFKYGFWLFAVLAFSCPAAAKQSVEGARPIDCAAPLLLVAQASHARPSVPAFGGTAGLAAGSAAGSHAAPRVPGTAAPTHAAPSVPGTPAATHGAPSVPTIGAGMEKPAAHSHAPPSVPTASGPTHAAPAVPAWGGK